MKEEDCIEYQFTVCGGITVVFIEVKQELGNLLERLDFIAHVIAESNGVVQNTLNLDES